MKQLKSTSILGAGAAIAISLGSASAIGQVEVYNSTVTSLDQSLSLSNEYGGTARLGGSDRSLVQFQFDYFASADLAGTATVRLYEDGLDPAGAPGALIYTSPDITLVPNGNQVVTIANIGEVSITDVITWTVDFGGVTAGEAGLRLYDKTAMTIGEGFDDYWENVGGTWTLNSQATDNAVFGAVVSAVPEPGMIALLTLGAGVLFLRRRR